MRKDAKQAYKLFECSPDHPSLRFKKLSGTKDRFDENAEKRKLMGNWNQKMLAVLAVSFSFQI